MRCLFFSCAATQRRCFVLEYRQGGKDAPQGRERLPVFTDDLSCFIPSMPQGLLGFFYSWPALELPAKGAVMKQPRKIPKSMRAQVAQAILDHYNNHPKYGGAPGAHKITQEEIAAFEEATKNGKPFFTEAYWRSVGL